MCIVDEDSDNNHLKDEQNDKTDNDIGRNKDKGMQDGGDSRDKECTSNIIIMLNIIKNSLTHI